MEKQQFDELVKQVGEQAATKIKEEVNNATKGLISEEKLNETLAKHNVKAEDIKIEGKSIAEILKAQGEAIEAAKHIAVPSAQSVSLATALVDGYKSMLKDGQLTNIRKGQWAEMEVKSVGTVTTANIDAVGTNSIPYNLASYVPGIDPIVRRRPYLAQLMTVGRTNKMYVQWTEAAAGEGGAATTAEGAPKSQYDIDLQEVSKKVEKITAYTKVSKEMLDDTPFIESLIRSELITIIALKLDDQLLNGSGTTPDLKGILQYATAFAAGDFAGYVSNPSEADVLRVAINQIDIANHNANYIVLHPSDVAKMELTKDSTGQYVMPPFASANGMMVKGLPVIANTGITAGTYLVGDFNKSYLFMREDAAIQIGWENDDFTKNLVTILAEVRATHFVKSQDYTAFVTGTFADDIEEIRKSA